MPTVSYPFNFLRGLSDFWMRFFADADQLNALYKGTAIQIGQAYLDLMSATLGVSLKDAVAFDREYYHLLALREDEVRFVEGATVAGNRWSFALPDPVVSFASLDNRVVEPTASLEEQRDYDISERTIFFKVDPTDPTGAGIPLDGYARRSMDVSVGGSFSDDPAPGWLSTNVKKGDTLRLLDVGPLAPFPQRRREDHTIVLVRDAALFVSPDAALASPTTGVNFVVLRVTPDAVITAETQSVVLNAIQLANTRIDEGSLRLYAKAPTGEDVVEGVDYIVDYEKGVISQLTAWQNLPGPYAVDYTWRIEVYPAGPLPPTPVRWSATGKIVSSSTTTRVIQMATWAPDTFVDRRTLSNNFGAFIGREGNSSEAYRAFLEGIFQLYILGPVLERIESALNVVLNLPVVRDDGEVYQLTDLSNLIVDRILTTNPANGLTVTYTFPKGTPLRTDLVAGDTLLSFEPLTTAVTVTDYIQTPSWWYGEAIPEQLFSPVNGVVPPIFRRLANPFYVENIVGAQDDPQVGDPGLYVGTDETGVVLSPLPTRIYRHRMAFVLMDQYLKFHTFSVRFDALALSVAANDFTQSLKDLNELVLSAKPSHTYVFTTPTTSFRDEVEVLEDDISFNRLVGSRVYGPDKVIFTDTEPVIGAGIWNVGDYFKYEYYTVSTAFPVVAVPVLLTNTPVPPRAGRLVRVYVPGDVGGVALIENVDYTVNYATRQVTRLTAWTSTTANVVWTQLNIGNLAAAPIGTADMPLLVNGVDPAHITAAFDPTAAGWDGVTTPPTAPRDIGLVERALIVYAHP
jgi:hypothetical protein